MQVKYNTDENDDKALQWLKEHYDFGRASPVARKAVLAFPDMYEELQKEKRDRACVEARLREIKTLIRDRNSIDARLREISEQEEFDF